jgi:tetratricopeptide (TPR) repeat protein
VQSGERRRASTPVRVVQEPERRGFSDPRKLAIYAAAGLVVWIVNFGLNLTWLGIPVNLPGVNSATVRADSIYKVGLQYDQARLWPESIARYREAINLQPGQDYYYLFLGRSWLEFAKQVENEREGSNLVENIKQNNPDFPENGNWRVLYNVKLDTPCEASPQIFENDSQRARERVCRLMQGEAVLNAAHDLNPLNTDHYANLGRLYLYWSEPTGGNDPTKTKLAVENFEASTRRTPGNAQLWDELGVAYARNGQFAKAMETLRYSQEKVDPLYARTPYLRGQLLQERAGEVRTALVSGGPVPTNGESDYGKLLLEAGQAYSDTIGLDPTQFVDGSHRARVDFMLQATLPFTRTNSTLPQETVGNVVTSTITLALEREAMEAEQALANYLRTEGAHTGPENRVPGALLQQMWQDPRWVAVTSDGARSWRDANIPTISKNAIAAHNALGYIYRETGRAERAKEEYDRVLLLDPLNQEAAEELKALSP